MSKIIMTKGAWGDWDCVIESYTMDGDLHCIKVGKPEGVHLDRYELLLKALAILGLEVECRSHWYETVTEEDGNQRGKRVDRVTSNMKD